jgi:hypothetical protein
MNLNLAADVKISFIDDLKIGLIVFYPLQSMRVLSYFL